MIASTSQPFLQHLSYSLEIGPAASPDFKARRSGPNRVASSFRTTRAGTLNFKRILISLRVRVNKKSAGFPALFKLSKASQLLDLGFLEFHVLARHWIIFHKRKLLSLSARILLGYIEKTSVSS